MKLAIITNLYPRPDQPGRGLFNAQLFAAMAANLDVPQSTSHVPCSSLSVICLVPEWRVWRWPEIRAWSGKNVGCGMWDVEQQQTGEYGLPCSAAGHKSFDSGSTVYGSKSTVFPSALYLPVFYIPLIARNWSWWTYERALRRTANLIRSCDCVLATWLYPDAVAAVSLARLLNKPFWIKVHGSDTFHMRNSTRRRLILSACAHAKGVISNCQYIQVKLSDAGVEQNKIQVIPNGVDTGMFRCRAGDESPSGGRRQVERKIVLFVGNLVYVKGPDVLLKAWKRVVERRMLNVGNEEDNRAGGMWFKEDGQQSSRLRSQNNGLKSLPELLIIGDGLMRKSLEKQAGQLGIAGSVRFLGGRQHKEVATWMRVANCLCLPSRSEGMPNVVLEALASGTPVVATDVGEVPFIIRDSENGFVVESAGDGLYQRMADALMLALDKEWDREGICAGIKGRTWERAAEKLLNALSEGV